MIKVWDLPTRVFHWLLVLTMALCIYTSYNFTEFYDLGILGNQSGMALHQYSGTLILSLLIFRVIWGLFGATTSRFSNFVKGPKHIIGYLRQSITHTEGHNPLGALMVLAMIGILLIQVITGLFLEDDTYIFSNAPLADTIKGDLRGNLLTIHSNGRAVLLWLIGLHVFAVFAYLVAKRQNLIKPMITGNRAKSSAHTQTATSINNDHPIIGLCLLAAIIAITFYLLFAK